MKTFLPSSLASLNESHMKFLLWEDSLSTFLKDHKKNLDSTLLEIEKKLTSSLSFLRDFIFFLKIRISQIFEFSQFSMSKLPKIQKSADNLGLYPELNQIYQFIDNYHVTELKKHQSDHHLLSQILDNHLIPFDSLFKKNLDPLRKRLKEEKEKSEDFENSRKETLILLISHFNKLVNNNNSFCPKSDIISAHISFLQLYSKLIKQIRSYSTQVLFFFKTASTLESQLLSSLSSSLSLYVSFLPFPSLPPSSPTLLNPSSSRHYSHSSSVSLPPSPLPAPSIHASLATPLSSYLVTQSLSVLPPSSLVPAKMIEIERFFPGMKIFEEVEMNLVNFKINFPPDGFENSLVKTEWMGRRVRREEGKKKEEVKGGLMKEGDGSRDIVVAVLIQSTVDGWTLIFDEELGGRLRKSGEVEEEFGKLGGFMGGGGIGEEEGEGKREEEGRKEEGGVEQIFVKGIDQERRGSEERENGEKEVMKSDEELSLPVFKFRTRNLEVKLLEDDRVEMKESKAKSLFAKKKSIIVRFDTKMDAQRFIADIEELIQEESNKFSSDQRGSFKEEINMSQINSFKEEEVKDGEEVVRREDGEEDVMREKASEEERKEKITILDRTEREVDEVKENKEDLKDKKNDFESEKDEENEIQKNNDKLNDGKQGDQTLVVEEERENESNDEEKNEI